MLPKQHAVVVIHDETFFVCKRWPCCSVQKSIPSLCVQKQDIVVMLKAKHCVCPKQDVLLLLLLLTNGHQACSQARGAAAHRASLSSCRDTSVQEGQCCFSKAFQKQQLVSSTRHPCRSCRRRCRCTRRGHLLCSERRDVSAQEEDAALGQQEDIVVIQNQDTPTPVKTEGCVSRNHTGRDTDRVYNSDVGTHIQN